jgi:hypothetical protein
MLHGSQTQDFVPVSWPALGRPPTTLFGLAQKVVGGRANPAMTRMEKPSPRLPWVGSKNPSLGDSMLPWLKWPPV